MNVLERIPHAWVTGGFVSIQAAVCLWCWLQTLRPLRRRAKELRAEAELARAGTGADRLGDLTRSPLALAWRRAYQTTAKGEHPDTEEAFGSQQLLPDEYDARLDAATPGLFTGLGIAGTFAGLLIAFGGVDFVNSQASIQPLVSGMRVAFINSLVGVLLALVWTGYSRRVRHRFERACRALSRTAETRFGRRLASDAVLNQLMTLREAVEGGLERTNQRLAALGAATEASSRDLLNSLAPQLEASFKQLVDMPFDRLNSTVAAYESSVSAVNEHHRQILEGLSASVGLLSDAQLAMGQMVETATACVGQFGATVEQLGAQTELARQVVVDSREAADSLQATASTIKIVGERHGQLASALGGAVTELRSSSGAMETVAAGFSAAAGRLEAAAAQIQSAGTEAAQDSVRLVREELQTAIGQMAESLTEFGVSTARAYEESSSRVTGAVDQRMSDLTDRLSAELNTLAARLPETMEQLNAATRDVRQQVTRAVRSLDEAVKRLDDGTRRSLEAQLAEYDSALAKAVDHFSGTLANWDGRVAELGAASKDLRTALASVPKPRPIAAPSLGNGADGRGDVVPA